MEYGTPAKFIKVVFSRSAYTYLRTELPDLEMREYKKKVGEEYREIVSRTPSVGTMKENDYAMTLYAGCYFLALYKPIRERMTRELIQGLIQAVSYSPIMKLAYKGKNVFSESEIKKREAKAKWGREHIEEYPMNWYYEFEKVPGKEEFYITQKQCAICKLTKQEGCSDITKYLCVMDYYSYDLAGVILDRTKILADGDEECNFHVMSKERAKEVGFEKSANAK